MQSFNQTWIHSMILNWAFWVKRPIIHPIKRAVADTSAAALIGLIVLILGGLLKSVLVNGNPEVTVYYSILLLVPAWATWYSWKQVFSLFDVRREQAVNLIAFLAGGLIEYLDHVDSAGIWYAMTGYLIGAGMPTLLVCFNDRVDRTSNNSRQI